jgi:predicted regulator of Ras-like GTPase activity (Roadblock/LC7/MglB family)
MDQMVAAVPGALGAMFLDHEGEAVAVSGSQIPKYDLQVIGAYSGIFLSNARRVCEDVRLGAADRLKIQCHGSNLFIAALNDGYYMVLVLNSDSMDAFAWRHLLVARERLNQEI